MTTMDGQLISTLLALTSLIVVLAMPDGGRKPRGVRG
jgi:hypothetical protein